MLYSISSLQKVLKSAIENFSYPNDVPGLYEPIEYMMSLGGKRLRPCLLLVARNMFSDDVIGGITLGMGVEFFHNFTLLHDDIMDNAPIRRGKTTVHEKWNKNTAILSGDAMIVEAYSMISSGSNLNQAQILFSFNEMARKVCEGQQLDMDYESRSNVQLAQYLNMITLKTAVLLGAALKIGALSAGADIDSSQLLYRAGCDMGIAFQLQDDLLDVYGAQEKFGKQVGGDILSNKKTWLLINAIEKAGPEEKTEINVLLDTAHESSLGSKEKVLRMTAVYDKLKIRETTEDAIIHYIQKAKSSLALLSVPEDRKQILAELLESINQREA